MKSSTINPPPSALSPQPSAFIPHPSSLSHPPPGFTLLELLIAVALLVVAMTMIVGTFMTTLRAWRRGDELLKDLHHGDFVMEQLVAAMRSAAYFSTAGDKYGFHLEDQTRGPYPDDVVSWVAAGTAFLPEDSPLTKGLHRIEVTIERNAEGERGFAVRAYPHLADEEETDEAEAWIVSTEIKGLNCRVYNMEDEDWDDEWEFTNSVPRLVELTLFMDPLEQYGEPVEMTRVVEIPLGSHENMAAGEQQQSQNPPAQQTPNPQGPQMKFEPGEADRNKTR